ncbi:MAG: TetR/AcrR family transcriptional regulator [Dehalococcoidales bacterium]|nr:TetR/AcrR family transcriptional regulator [Dehalococcoidales bacterium]
MVRNYETTTIRRKQILDAARKVIFKYGSESLTVKKIAEEVGISETDIYRHYKSKTEVISFLVDDIGEILIKEIAEGKKNGYTSLGVLHDVLQSHLSSIEQKHGSAFQIISIIISLGDNTLNKKVADVIKMYMASLVKLLDDGVKSGEIREDIDLDVTAVAVIGLIHGLVNIWALNDSKFDPVKYQRVCNVFDKALIKVDKK